MFQNNEIKDMPLVSIIVPVYNAEKFLKKCLDSICRQTYKNLEILLIDDGSDDHSRIICEQYAMQDHRIEVEIKDNGGVSSARNVGIEKATGKYIMFVDSDDICKPNEVFVALEAIEENQVDEVIFGMCAESSKQSNKQVFNKHKFVGKEIRNNIDYIMLHGLSSPWNKIYLRDNIIKWGIRFDETLSLGEDLNFNIRYLLNCKSILYIPEVLYLYHIENSTATKRYREDMYEQRLLSLNKMVQIFQDYDMQYLHYGFSRVKLTYAAIFNIQHKDCKMNYKEKIYFVQKLKSDYLKENIDRIVRKDQLILDLIIRYFPVTMIYILSFLINKIKRKLSIEKRGISV